MENFTVRSATLEDLDILRVFEQGVISAETAFDPTLKTETQYYNFSEMLKAQHIKILVAETASKEVIGSGFARIESAPPYLAHDRYAYLAYMFVKPAYRRQGVNKVILDELKAWSSSQGLHEIRLKVYVKNTGALDAYRKAGFEDHALEMRISMD